MRRKHNNLAEDIILYVGYSKIIVMNNNLQITSATRTLLLNEKVIYTFKNPLSSIKDTKLSAFSQSKNPPISLQNLSNHEYEYKLTPQMRPKLLLGRLDPGVQSYLKQLKITNLLKDDDNVVAIANLEDCCMHGFVFNKESEALKFYESLNIAIITQIYLQRLPQNLTFNYKISNMLGETMNGHCVVDPNNFMQGKQETPEIVFTQQMMKFMKSQALTDFSSGLFELSLRFKIKDETSCDYAYNFINSLPERIEQLVLNKCEMTSNTMGQLLTSYKPSLCDKKLISLRFLVLAGNYLDDDVLTNISKLFKSSSQLSSLDLSQNSLTFEKEPIIASFLTSISTIKIKLNANKNKISSPKLIIKYLINAEGNIPISSLDVSQNPFTPEDLNTLVKVYLLKSKEVDKFIPKIHVHELELAEPNAFEFLKAEYWLNKPKAMSIPFVISKHVVRKNGKELGNTEEEINTSALIDGLYKEYARELYNNNFYAMKGLKAKIKELGVSQEEFEEETQRLSIYRQQQQQMIIMKMQSCLNFQVKPQNIIKEMNSALRYARRKKLSGLALQMFAVTKDKMEGLMQLWLSEKNLGISYRKVIFQNKERYKYLYDRSFVEDDSIVNVDYKRILNMSEEDLITQYLAKDQMEKTSKFLVYHYLLLLQKPTQYHQFLIQACLTDPRLASTRVIRFERETIVEFTETKRIGRLTLPVTSKIQMASYYGIENYNFGSAFIESGVSSSAYRGMLSPHKIETDNQKVLAFIQICKNFFTFLYLTPNQLSDQSVMYISYITDYLLVLQTERENDLKNILVEEMIIHLITFFDSSIHQPLQPSILISIFQFITRRITIQEELLRRLAAHLIKGQTFKQDQLMLYIDSGVQPWEVRVDWQIKDTSVLKHHINKRCKIQISIANIAHPEKSFSLEVDQLDTISDLWALIKLNLKAMQQVLNISEQTIDLCWICSRKGNLENSSLKLFASYEHIGNLIFGEKYQTTFYVRRIIYRPQEHSLKYLEKIAYQQILSIYDQSKVSFRDSTYFLLEEESEGRIKQLIIEAIWIDALLIQDALRRQSDEESTLKYMQEREKIINGCISELYNKYLPVGSSLDDQGRMSIILELKSRQTIEIGKNIKSVIKQQIYFFLQKLGTIGYTLSISDITEKYYFHVNNYSLAFIDRSESKIRKIQVKFKDLLWFELVNDGEPLLKFEVVETINQHFTLHKFSIRGDNLWISQCYLMIVQICRNRLSYPTDLLFRTEDSKNNFSSVAVRGMAQLAVSKPILDLNKYFKFTQPRKMSNKNIKSNSPGNNQVVKQAQKQQQSYPSPSQNKPTAGNQQPKIKQPDLKIEQIIEASNKEEEEEQNVIMFRKSAAKKEAARTRKSRNR